MPRVYMPGLPDIPGQRYEKTIISETIYSPRETAGDIHGMVGGRILSGALSEVVHVVRRFRYRLGWDLATTEEAVDIEYAAVELGADGTGALFPFIEWEETSQVEYPDFGFGNLFALPEMVFDGISGDFIGPFHWWDVSVLTIIDNGGSPISTGWPDGTNHTMEIDEVWNGNVPVLTVDGAAGTADMSAEVTGRRIRMVTVEPGSYFREKHPRALDRWICAVTLIEKETGIAPGYRRQ
jgi:hypothetical protein